MFNLDPAKLLIIGVVAIILLGPDKLPQVARQVGGAWRAFTEYRQRMEAEVRGSLPDLPPTTEIARLARSPSALLHHLSTMDGTSPEEDAAAVTEGPESAEARGAESSGNGNVPSDPTTPMPTQTVPTPPEVIVLGDPNLN